MGRDQSAKEDLDNPCGGDEGREGASSPAYDASFGSVLEKVRPHAREDFGSNVAVLD